MSLGQSNRPPAHDQSSSSSAPPDREDAVVSDTDSLEDTESASDAGKESLGDLSVHDLEFMSGFLQDALSPDGAALPFDLGVVIPVGDP